MLVNIAEYHVYGVQKKTLLGAKKNCRLSISAFLRVTVTVLVFADSL